MIKYIFLIALLIALLIVKCSGEIHGDYEISYKNGTLWREAWYENDLLQSDDDLPAKIIYYSDGITKHAETWYQGGKTHRNKGPALISYLENGNKKYEYWFQDNFLHRDDGPANIVYSDKGGIESQVWYDHGEYQYHTTHGEYQIPLRKVNKNKK